MMDYEFSEALVANIHAYTAQQVEQAVRETQTLSAGTLECEKIKHEKELEQAYKDGCNELQLQKDYREQEKQEERDYIETITESWKEKVEQARKEEQEKAEDSRKNGYEVGRVHERAALLKELNTKLDVLIDHGAYDERAYKAVKEYLLTLK
ncbi:MAG: hypothetical protein AB9866_18875 [Syntrophobacteraceae bacterium]